MVMNMAMWTEPASRAIHTVAMIQFNATAVRRPKRSAAHDPKKTPKKPPA
jgi:hypothetical protein